MILPSAKSVITHIALLPLLLLATFACKAGTINIAVASNFAQTLHTLVEAFENKTGHKARISSASTGKLYTQIQHGAPFDIFLAADEARPDLLITEGKADTNMSRTYAKGKLVLLSNINPVGDCKNVLTSDKLKRLAIANPKTAPYGAAAKQVLQHMGLWHDIKHRLAMGENIAQPLQFVSTGNASAGFVAKSMLLQNANISGACQWDVPTELYSPIKQKMVVLNKSANKQAVKEFWSYMQTEAAIEIIQNSGYDTI